MKRVERLVQSKHPEANNRDKDNTFISHIVVAHQSFRVVESFVILVTLGIFMGQFWYFASRLQYNFNQDFNGEGEKTMLSVYKLDSLNAGDLFIVMTYIAVTTLATVGLGDFHPFSTFERLIATISMVIGVVIFSQIFQQVGEAI